MATVPIPNLPAAITLTGNEEIAAIQSGVAVRVTSAQLGALGGTVALPWTVNTGGTGDTNLPQHGVLIGAGTAPINVSAVGSTGTVLAGNTNADPTFQSFAALMMTYLSSLPTSLPGTSGVLWNNNGVLSIS